MSEAGPHVVYIGNFKHPFCTEVYVTRALREVGCTVGEIQQETANEIGPDRVEEMIRDAKPCQLVLYTRTHSGSALIDLGWTLMWQRLERDGIKTASVHLDRFWDLNRETLITQARPDPMFTMQHVFTADGGNDSRWHEYGIDHHWMAPAVDRFECEEMPGIIRPHLTYDVVFAGSGGAVYHGQYRERGQLIDHLRKTYGRRFAHFGHAGDFPVVRQQDLNDLYVSAKVIVGDSCFANEKGSPRSAFYWSDRVPETLGRGGFLIHPYVPGIRTLPNGVPPLATYAPGDWEDLDAQIGAFLANPGERESAVTRGRRDILAGHTWTVRVGQILDTVGLGQEERV